MWTYNSETPPQATVISANIVSRYKLIHSQKKNANSSSPQDIIFIYVAQKVKKRIQNSVFTDSDIIANKKR